MDRGPQSLQSLNDESNHRVQQCLVVLALTVIMEAYTVQTCCQILLIPIQHLILDLEGPVVHLEQLVELPLLGF